MLLWCVLLWLAGTLGPFAGMLTWIGGMVLSVSGWVLGRRRPGWWLARALSACLLLPIAASYAAWRRVPVEAFDWSDWIGQRVQLVAVVESARGEPGRVSAFVRIETPLRPARFHAHGRLQATWPTLQPPLAGTRWLLDGELARPGEAVLPGLFDRARWLSRQGIDATLRVKRWAPLAGEPTWLDGLRAQLIPIFTAGSDGVRGPLAASLVFGVSAAPIDPEVSRTFRSLGLTHMLAASGFQLALLVATVMSLFSRVGRRWAIAACVPLLVCYVALTGAPPSVMRAAGVTFVGLAGRWFDRPTVATRALLLVAWGLLVWNPGYAEDLGFAFSVLATWGLLVTAPRIEEHLKRRFPSCPDWARLLIVAPIAAQIWVMPLQLHAFGLWSWLSLPANVVSGFLVDWLTKAGFVAALLGLVWSPLAWPFTKLMGWLLAAWLPLLDWAANLPEQAWFVPRPGLWATALAYTALALLHAPRERWGDWAPIGGWAIACSLIALPLLPQPRTWQWTFLPVGAGTASHLRLPGGGDWLIDCGAAPYIGGERWDSGARRIVPYLEAEGIRRLAGVVLTSSAGHHTGGLGAVIEALAVGRIVDAAGQSSPSLERTAPNVLAKSVPWEPLPSGGWQWPDGTRLHSWITQRQDGQSVLSIHWVLGKTSILVPGDIDEAAATGIAWPRSEILVLPDHGRSEACPEAFLEAVQPTFALVDGAAKRWGRPKADLRRRLDGRGIRWWDTARNGPLRLETDGRSWWMSRPVGDRWETVDRDGPSPLGTN